MKKLLFMILALLLTSTTALAFIDSYVISRDNLPEEAQAMLDKYFPKAKGALSKSTAICSRKPTMTCASPTARPSNSQTKASGNLSTAESATFPTS